MMKRILFLILAVILLTASNIFAQYDVLIDSSGNVKTGVANTDGNLEVTGASGEDGIVGSTSGTGAAGVYGINTTSGNYGILGYDSYGIFGYSLGGYAGYFEGNARVTGNLTVDGSIIGPVIGDITDVNAGTGLTGGGTSGSVTLNVNTTAIQQRVTGPCAEGSSIRTVNSDGTVVCETDDVGLLTESDPEVGINATNYVPKWNGSELVTGALYDNGNVGIGTASPGSKLHIAGGGWDLTNTEGDFKIGDATYRLKIGIANGGGGAGDVRIRSHGGTNRLMLGGGTNDVLTVTDSNVGIGTISPSSELTVAGTIESTSGGIKFPDGTVQTTASAPTWHQILPAAQRFVLVMNNNEAVLDIETGLVWEKSPVTTIYTWMDAISYCTNLNTGGRKGWHLPTIEQLASLIDISVSGSLKLPTGHPFLNVQTFAYWSANTNAVDTTYAWYITIGTGTGTSYRKINPFHVWCVRGGQSHDAY